MAGRRLEEDAWRGSGRPEAGIGTELSAPPDGPDDDASLLRPWEAGLRFAEREIASGPPLGTWRIQDLEATLRGAA